MSHESKLARDEFLSRTSDNDYESQNCYICNSKKFRIISEIDRYGFYYPTGVCEKCGNIQQVRYYNEEKTIDFYSNYYRNIYGNKPNKLFEAQKKIQGKNVHKFIDPIIKPKKVLEVGCGAGGILSVFKDAGADVLGLDFDDDYLSIARNMNISVRKGSLEKISDNEKFDLIILSHVLEHIVNPSYFLEKLSTHLNNNGIIYIEVPSINNVSEGGYQYDLLNYWQNAHTIHFTNKTLGMLCKKIGLEAVAQSSYINSCWKKSLIKTELSLEEMQEAYKDTTDLLNSIENNRKSIKALKMNLKFTLIKLLNKLGLSTEFLVNLKKALKQ